MKETKAVAFARRASPPAGFVRTLLQLRGPYTFLIALAPGFILVITSILFGLHDFSVPAAPTYVPMTPDGRLLSRQVGFLFAPNWSINYLLLLPLIAYLMLEVVGGFHDALDNLYEREMVRDDSFAVIDDGEIVRSWFVGTKLRTGLLIGFAVIVPVLISGQECYANNLLPIFHRGSPPAGPKDYDWGLRALVEGSVGLTRMLNAAFDVFAFSCQALLLSMIIAFFLLCLDLGRAIGRAPRLVPDLRSENPRRGFEDFEEPLQQLLVVTLIAYMMCYFIRLENVYLAAPGFTSLGHFINADILGGAAAAVQDKGWKAGLASLFSTPAPVSRQTFMAGSAAFLILVFTFMLVVMTVGSAARRSRSLALRYLSSRGGDERVLFGLASTDERERLKTMDVWPLSYFSLNVLLGLAVMAMFTMYFYRIGLFVVGFVTMLIFVRLLTHSVRKAAVP